MSASRAERQASGPNLRIWRLKDLALAAQADLKRLGTTRGYLPEARMDLAQRPEVLRGLNRMDDTSIREDAADPALKLLVAQMSGAAAGCRHCQTPTAFGAHRHGVPDEKVARPWEHGTSPLSSAAGRAALDLASTSSTIPSAALAALAAHLDRLREHFDEGEIVEIMAVVDLFGWNKPWSDGAGTSTSSATVACTESVLSSSGRRPGKHAGHGACDTGPRP